MDVSTKTQAEIDALAAAGADRPVTVTPHVTYQLSALTFYMADARAPSAGLHVSARNQTAFVDFRLADISGPVGPTNCFTNAEALQLANFLKRLHVFMLHP